MSNAKVYYYANGYRGVSGALATMPIGYIYMSTASTNPGTIFGGTWQPIGEGLVLISAGTHYTAGTTVGSSSVTLTEDNIPAHTHGSASLTGSWEFDTKRIGGTTTPSGIISNRSKSTSAYFSTTSSSDVSNTVGFDVDASHTHTSFGKATPNAVSTIQPSLVVYMWERIA